MYIVIDGSPYSAEPGETILSVAQRNGIEIPTLCHHEALWGQACCRLCLVEAEAGSESTIVVSCTYPVTDKMQFHTHSEKVMRLRKNILSLLIEEAPEAEGKLKQYCEDYGVTGYGLRFTNQLDEKCILCGLCVQACEELGNCAIQTTMRGIDKIVAPPFDEPPEDCIGCAACSRVCPTGKIISEDSYDPQTKQYKRTIWQKHFELKSCAACNKPFATVDELQWLRSKLIDCELNLDYCPQCRKTASISGLS
jgi:NADH dehydrogenase/NADH:ubiquinone oxidoreductase subunit G